MVYRPFGPLYTLSYGNGLALQRLYGQNYQLMGISVTGTSPAPLNLTVNHDNAGSISSITDNASTGRGASYAFTSSGRLQTARGAWGQYAYRWDGAGNMTERDQTVGGTTTYGLNTFSTTSNQIVRSTDNAGHPLRTFQYFAGGEENEDDRSAAATYDYIYDFMGRVVGVNLNGVNVSGYGYDAFGARVWKQIIAPSTHTQYVFDLSGRLLAEHDGTTGKVLKEYVWIDDMPVAVVDSSSGTAKTYYIHTGPVNEPLVMTDASKAQVWNAYMEPFGAATVFGSNSASIDLRLPGQWLQAETGGLNQNWFRDYDPTLGRYLQPDPLGVSAAQNVYAYVDGKPLDRIDRWGLWSFSLNFYGGVGGGFSFGQDPETGQAFFSGRLGLGFGGGANYDPTGKPPGDFCPGQKYGSVGAVAQAGVSVPGAEVGIEAASGVNFSSGGVNPYGPDVSPSSSFNNSIGLELGYSVSGQATGYWP